MDPQHRTTFVRLWTVGLLGLVWGPLAMGQPSLPEALDNSLLWNTGGSAFWLGQTEESSDGVDAARSGALAGAQESWLETIVNGPGRIDFWWKTSSEAIYDRLVFSIDGVEQGSRSGKTEWASQTYYLGAQSHALRWTYLKDASASDGQDAAWLDQVAYAASANPVAVVSPDHLDLETPVGTPLGLVTLQLSNSGVGNLDYSWVEDAVWITQVAPASGTATAAPTNVTVNLAVSNLAPGLYETTLFLTGNGLNCPLAVPVRLLVKGSAGTALDNTTLVFQPTEYSVSDWFAQSAIAYDGEDAMRSGPVTALDYESGLKTTTENEGILRFYWKTSCAPTTAACDFTVDFAQGGSFFLSRSGEGEWQQETVYFFANPDPVGSAAYPFFLEYEGDQWALMSNQHELAWQYYKYGEDVAGQDAAFLDQVEWLTDVVHLDLSAPPGGVAGRIPSQPLYLRDGTAQIQAVADPAWTFLGWIGDVTGTANPASVTLDRTKGVAPLFGRPLAAVTHEMPSLSGLGGGWSDWHRQSAVTRDGLLALQSGTVTDNQFSWMQTTVNGPGTFDFYWQVSSEPGWDFLLFFLNDSLQDGISGTIDWQRKTLALPAGPSVLRWIYVKDSSLSEGADAGWVDLVGWPQPGTYAAWQTVNYTPPEAANPLVGGMAVAPSGDGITNLMKYALGAGARDKPSAFLPVAGRTVVGSGAGAAIYPTLTFVARDDDPLLTYRVEVAEDLANWDYNGKVPGLTVVTMTSESLPNRMRRIVATGTNPLTSQHPHRSLRLVVSHP